MEKDAGQCTSQAPLWPCKKADFPEGAAGSEAIQVEQQDDPISMGSALNSGVQSDKRAQGKQNSGSEERRQREWSVDEERMLVELHNLKGNRWVEIARELQRSDNSVKNHYHSRLRKALRKINKCIVDHLSHQSKPLKTNLLSKIIQTAEAYYTHSIHVPKAQAAFAYRLKNDIIAFAELSQEQTTQQQIYRVKQIVGEIERFNGLAKRQEKAKKVPRPNNNKYKGKEILSLLQENEMKRQIQANIEKARASEDQESILQHNEQENMDMRKETGNFNSNMPFFGNFQHLYYYNQNMYPFCYPLYNSPFYPHYPSFSFFPECDKTEPTTWNSITHIETQRVSEQSPK